MGAVRSHRLGLGAAAVVIGVAAIAVPASLGHASSVTPSIRLVAGTKHVEVDRFGSSWDLYVPESAYIEATHGAFEIDATRSHGLLALEQVVRHGDRVTKVRAVRTPERARFSAGLPKFLTVVMRDSTGQVVTSAHPSFCPTASYDGQRIDPFGVDNPTFPQQCGSPLTRATVWGIDQGWADPAYFQLVASPEAAPDGTYTMSVVIAPPYRHEFRLTAAESSISLDVTLVTQTGGGCKDICPPGPERRHARTGHTAQAAPAPGGNYPGQADTSGGLPDLVALPAHGLSTSSTRHHDYLNFGATIWNAGPGTFDVEGFRRGGRPTMDARQYIYRDGQSVRSMNIGTFEFDTRVGHHHWHLEDVARYDLLDPQHGHVVRSGKQSFCLAPTDPINLTLPGALWNPDTVGLASACPANEGLWLRETLPVGWGDTYVQQKGGQAFDITNVANGQYLIQIKTNPFGRIHETTRTDNTSLVAVTLGGTVGARTVSTAPPVG